MYECTSEDRERDGKKMKPECVVRRGDTMEMKVTFRRDYEKKKHDLTLQFTIGRSAIFYELEISFSNSRVFGPDKKCF